MTAGIYLINMTENSVAKELSGGTQEFNRDSLSKTHGIVERAAREVVDWKGWGK